MKFISRNALVFNKNQLNKINSSTVVIAGVGGLGSIVSEILSRMNIKRLIIIDNGIVDEPDLERQTLYDYNDIGRRKVEVAKEKLMKKTKTCHIDTFFEDIQENKLSSILREADGFVDCLDNYEGRFALEKQLTEKQFLIHGGVENTYGQITTIIKNKTPLLSEIYYGFKTENKIVGVSTTAVFIIASLMAQEVINNIIGTPELINKLLVVNCGDFSFSKLTLKR